jgi:hypothetical protein
MLFTCCRQQRFAGLAWSVFRSMLFHKQPCPSKSAVGTAGRSVHKDSVGILGHRTCERCRLVETERTSQVLNLQQAGIQ